MQQAFVEYELRVAKALEAHSLVGVPLGSRLQRIERFINGWRLWISTADFKHGTYMLLYDTGEINRVVARADEGDEITYVRPSDDHIRRQVK